MVVCSFPEGMVLSNILAVTVCNSLPGAKYKEEVLKHMRRHSVPYTWIHTQVLFLSAFLDIIQTLSIKKLFK